MADKNTQFVSHTNAVEAYSKAMNEPEWMLTLRQDALAEIDQLDKLVVERLRYTRWPLWNVPSFDTERSANEIDVNDYIEPNADANRVVQVGTESVMENLPQSLIDQGVIFTDMKQALIDHPEKVKEA